MKLVKTAEGKTKLKISKEEWERIGNEQGWMTKEAWPEKVKKGRFTEWCKRNGFDGPCIECAKKAADSDDASVRGMSTFYMNTVKPKGKDASDV